MSFYLLQNEDKMSQWLMSSDYVIRTKYAISYYVHILSFPVAILKSTNSFNISLISYGYD